MGIEDLRSHLKQLLPDHMFERIRVLEKFPLTRTEARQTSPAPPGRAGYPLTYAAPYGELEERLADIWRIYCTSNRSADSINFFGLGGHSLLALQLVIAIDNSLSVNSRSARLPLSITCDLHCC